MKKQGFTLIELLAVIVILGIVMAIAIPGINMVINNTRKNSFVREAQLFVNAARNKVRAEEVKIPNNPNEVTIISVNALEMDKGGKTSSFNLPWNYNKSYVLIHNEGENGEQKLVYYIALADEGNNSLSLTKSESNLVVTDSSSSIIIIGTGLLMGSPTGTTNMGTFSFSPLSDITIANVYIAEISEELGEGDLPNTPEIQYVNRTPAPNPFPCEINGNTFTHFIDKRNNVEYPVIQVGNICIMNSDLAFTSQECLLAPWDDSSPHNACRINGGTGPDKNSVLYQWELANTTCPSGWQLINESHVDMINNEWDKYEEVLEDYDFDENILSIFPAGIRDNAGNLDFVEFLAAWWTSLDYDSTGVLKAILAFDTEIGNMGDVSLPQSFGSTVRCIKN